MKATMQDEAFVKHAGQFVWLALDFDDAKNAPFFATHDIGAGLPAFFVIDAEHDRLLRVLFGGARVADMERFLDASAAGPADEAVQRGDALLTSGHAPEAVTAYGQALTQGGTTWPGHDHAVEQLLIALQAAGDFAGCTALARREAPQLPRTRAFINAAQVALGCKLAAGGLHAGDPPSDEEAWLREAQALPVAAEDDRYSAYDTLIQARRLRHDNDGALTLAREYLALVASAPTGTGDRRMARDLARLRAATALGDTAGVIPALSASDRLLADGNSAARLAAAQLGAQRTADAIATCTRGLSRAAGPTVRARLLRLRAQAERAAEPSAARRDLEAALRLLPDIPVAAARTALEAQVRAALAALR
jgi:hypothetical protein